MERVEWESKTNVQKHVPIICRLADKTSLAKVIQHGSTDNSSIDKTVIVKTDPEALDLFGITQLPKKLTDKEPMTDNETNADTVTDKQMNDDMMTKKDKNMTLKEQMTDKEEKTVEEIMTDKDEMMDKDKLMEKDKLMGEGQMADNGEKQLESTTVDEFSVESFEPTNTHQSAQVEKITQGQKQGKNSFKFLFKVQQVSLDIPRFTGSL